MERRVTATIALIMAFSMVSGGAVIILTDSSESDGRPMIYTSMNWQKEMVQEIVGRITPCTPSSCGQGPPHYTETQGCCRSGKGPFAYFYIGAGMAGRTDT